MENYPLFIVYHVFYNCPVVVSAENRKIALQLARGLYAEANMDHLADAATDDFNVYEIKVPTEMGVAIPLG